MQYQHCKIDNLCYVKLANLFFFVIYRIQIFNNMLFQYCNFVYNCNIDIAILINLDRIIWQNRDYNSQISILNEF